MESFIVIPRNYDVILDTIEDTYWEETSTYQSSPEFLRELTNEQQLSIRQESMEKED